jgi:hypothetical protein
VKRVRVLVDVCAISVTGLHLWPFVCFLFCISLALTRLLEQKRILASFLIVAADLIESHRREIRALKEQLALERTVRRHKEEYEALAHIINGFASRDATQKYAVDAVTHRNVFWSFHAHNSLQNSAATLYLYFVKILHTFAFRSNASFSFCRAGTFSS